MLDNWAFMFCNRLNGYFWDECKSVDNQGSNSWTFCEKGSYAIGLERGGHNGMDQSKLRCCKMVYAAPLTGAVPLPDNYDSLDGRFTFRRFDNKFLRTLGNHEVGKVDAVSDHWGAWEKFALEIADANKGLYKIRTDQDKHLKCKEDSEDLVANEKSKNGVELEAEFQFF